MLSLAIKIVQQQIAFCCSSCSKIRDCYHFESYAQIVVSPFPSFFWLFREKFLEITLRLWLEFIPSSVAEINITTEKYSDNCVLNECIRWLELPLEQQRKCHNDVEPDIIGDDFNWQAPLLTGSERILHIGSENASLNMKKMIQFVAALANVCCFFSFSYFFKDISSGSIPNPKINI